MYSLEVSEQVNELRNNSVLGFGVLS